MSNIVSEPPHLFVYGTLRRSAGTKWSQFLESASSFAGMGRTRGALFRLGSYPGMTLRSGEDSWVRGDVFLLKDPLSVLPVLDDYEGYEYRRQVVVVLLDDGRTIQAWAYLYLLDTSDKPRILSGDYLRPD